MSGCCDKDVCNPGAVAKPDAAWRRVLIIALCANASMFVVELAAGLTAGSSALQADALDFLADADETSTKLDLARAYIDMGDRDGAKDILDEVLIEGNDNQKQEARDLLNRLEA